MNHSTREEKINPLRDFPAVFITTLTLSRIIGSITVAFLCGLFISYLYRLTYKGTSYSTSYVHSLVAFAMITTIVIMVIGNNLARAFGLVGSMSIIRFRMAIKDTHDIVFIFFTLAIGMAAGVGQHMVAVVATLYIGILVLLISSSKYASPHRREYLLQFHFTSENDEDAPYIDVFKKFCKKYKLINIKSLGENEIYELSYYVVLKKKEAGKEFISELGSIEGLNSINFFFDEQ
ncbi:DUF4956 domain-containing protein [Candidatus Latescibacterota bacterium]